MCVQNLIYRNAMAMNCHGPHGQCAFRRGTNRYGSQHCSIRGLQLIFASDNWSGAHPAINENILRHSGGKVAGYNSGELDRKVEAMLGELFEREVAVFFVSTGTAANSLAISVQSKPGGVTFCHHEAHVKVDECGGPEFFSGGRLCGVSGKNAKMNIQALKDAIAQYPRAFVHHGRPGAISLTQTTEYGTLYTPEEIAAIAAIAREHEIPMHMDGARFANAVASLGVTPAEMTWKAGIDYLSFGGTKNGCWCAEALICFDPAMREELAFHHKRAGQLFSKSRFIAAQFEAYLSDGLWLVMARHANAMTVRLKERLSGSNRVRYALEPQANESFLVMEEKDADGLRKDGAVFFNYAVPAGHEDLLGEGENLYRFVTSFATTGEEVDQFAALVTR